MLVDILETVPREHVTDGVLLYRFPLGSVAPGEYFPDKTHSVRQRLGLLFCRGGAITLRRSHGADVNINREDIVLLSDFPDLTSIVVHEPLIGCCLDINLELSTAFSEIYQAVGYTPQIRETVQAFLHERGGCLNIKHGSWSQSIFFMLHSLPDSDHGSYCLLKAAELFYLLSTHQALSGDIACQPAMPSYLMELLHCIGTYIENHLDEKLTISLLCHQFNLSPTTLKNKFREFYGQPIHSWILYRRIRRAAELLQFTNMTVLQIAQSVGYESASQFNVVFRRSYGIPPNVYRKNVRFRQDSTDFIGNGEHPTL